MLINLSERNVVFPIMSTPHNKFYHTILFLALLKISIDKFEFVGVLHANTVSRIFEPRRMARRHMVDPGAAASAAEPGVR